MLNLWSRVAMENMYNMKYRQFVLEGGREERREGGKKEGRKEECYHSLKKEASTLQPWKLCETDQGTEIPSWQ